MVFVYKLQHTISLKRDSEMNITNECVILKSYKLM